MNTPAQVRAKVRCESLTQFAAGGKSVKFLAVQNGSTENKSFSQYTPSLNLEMAVSDGTAAADLFVPGKEYYLDFIPADAPPQG